MLEEIKVVVMPERSQMWDYEKVWRVSFLNCFWVKVGRGYYKKYYLCFISHNLHSSRVVCIRDPISSSSYVSNE